MGDVWNKKLTQLPFNLLLSPQNKAISRVVQSQIILSLAKFIEKIEQDAQTRDSLT